MTLPQLWTAALAAHSAGRAAEAESLCRQILAIHPDEPEALHLLGILCHRTGRAAEAAAYLARSAAIRANNPHTHTNLAVVLIDLRRFEEAIDSCRRAIKLAPDFAEAWFQLGLAHQESRRLVHAIDAYRRALKHRPADTDALCNMAICMIQTHWLDDAIPVLQRILEIDPKYVDAHNRLAGAYASQCRIDAALTEAKRALDIAPDNPAAVGNYLYLLHLDPTQTPDQIFTAHRTWGARHSSLPTRNPQLATRNFSSPLHLAYLSPDLRHHSIAYFLLPLLENHDRKKFHITLYHTHHLRDAVSDRLQSLSERWFSLHNVSDDAAAQCIADDKIDILIDLAGHTAHNRLLLMARKPAPIQATWLGYPDTTGLTSIDYRITDSLADPPGADSYNTEKLFRLPRTAWCFHPLSGSPPIHPSDRSHIVFGSFNAAPKLNAPLLALWSRILNEVPDSRLLLKARDLASPTLQQWLREQFESHSIDPTRIELLGRQQSNEEHIAAYNRVDIALDTFPYNGTTTTCEALWMGVPVITLAGANHCSRVGASLLTSAGLPDLVASDPAAYVHLATALARDKNRLRDLRLNLRSRLQTSPLMDAQTFTRDMEAAFLKWIS